MYRYIFVNKPPGKDLEPLGPELPVIVRTGQPIGKRDFHIFFFSYSRKGKKDYRLVNCMLNGSAEG